MGESKRKACVFCGTGKVTLEHVWPQWMREVIVERLGTSTWAAVHNGKSRLSEVVDAKVKRVCNQCNTGWMSKLEQTAKPILVPMMFAELPDTELSLAEQRTLATWAMKTALMAAFFYPRERFALRVYSQFYADRVPPPNAYVWTAAYGGPRVRLETLVGPSMLEIPAKYLRDGIAAKGALVKHGRIATLGILRAVFQVLVHYATATPLTIEDGVVLQRLWPPTDGPIMWPLHRRSLDDADFEGLATRTGYMRPHDIESFKARYE